MFRLVFFLCALIWISPAAYAMSCPEFSVTPSISSDEAIQKIDACIEARSNGSANTIEDYQCPSGDYVWETSEALTTETLAYHITVNLLMNDLDKKTKEYMKQLQKSRDKNAVAWTENIRTCLRDNGPEAITLSDAYRHICRFAFIQEFLNDNGSDRIMIGTTNAYPQRMCEEFAEKKIEAWETMGKHLMHDNINKSYQNDRDIFVDQLQNSYDRVLARFHQYQRVVARASAKIKVYIRTPVR